jgi:two-component system NtrC family response regulator
MPTILIVDDDPAVRESLAEALTDMGHTALEAPDGETALALVGDRAIDAILLDLRMPGLDGLEVLRRLRARPDAPPVAVLTAVPTAANTIEAMRLGAVDHLAKPIGRADLVQLLARLLPAKRAGVPISALETGADELIGTSAPMREIAKQIGRLADSDATVLLTGETGTGKEVVARAIHRHGRRVARSFVAVNCAAIPPGLLESQLFGHVRGAFTGAIGSNPGSFRDADGGTLFLDEIGEMDPAMQAKLLRVLQDRVVTPLGGRPAPVDVRLISATNRDLQALVRAGKFREDLFWRLGVVPLHMPPLRERLADILPLAEHFLAGTGHTLSAAAAARLLSHRWPGNVRELRNAMERAAALAGGPVIDAIDLDFLHTTAPAETDWLAGDLPAAVARLEAAMIRRALDAAGGNRAEAARRLNIHRQLLYEKMRRYGLEASENRTDAVGNADGSAGGAAE